jgi:hypothetical protein
MLPMDDPTTAAPQDLTTLKNENRFFKDVRTAGSPKKSGSASISSISS